jgi:hypothetical protein
MLRLCLLVIIVAGRTVPLTENLEYGANYMSVYRHTFLGLSAPFDHALLLDSARNNRRFGPMTSVQ